MLTLESAVEVLDIDFRPMDFMKELFMSTPNLNKEPRPDMKKSATVALRQSPPHHVRSTSYSLAVFNRRSVPMAPVVEAKGKIVFPIPCLHRVKLSGFRCGSFTGSISRRCTCLHGTFTVPCNKDGHIVVHCSVIVTFQST